MIEYEILKQSIIGESLCVDELFWGVCDGLNNFGIKRRE